MCLGGLFSKKAGWVWFLGSREIFGVRVCEPGTAGIRAACSANLARARRQPRSAWVSSSHGSPSEPNGKGEREGEKGAEAPPNLPRPALPAPRTHTAKDRRFPPFATGCELQIKVPVLLGGEPAAQAAGGARGWERGEQRSAASLPSPDDPRPQVKTS